MKITAVAGWAFVAATSVHAGRATQAANNSVTVCTENSFDQLMVKYRAQQLASRMFALAGVFIDWRGSGSCPKGAIKISFSRDTPPNRLPGSLAYARPFDGVHIEIFYDRIRSQNIKPDRLLGHVMVHEITHILQGSNWHAETGIMKPNWTVEDLLTISEQALPFTPLDLKLIQLGMAARVPRVETMDGKVLVALVKEAR
jgi:hypothetical protein